MITERELKFKSAQAMKNHPQTVIVVCLLKLLSWSNQAIAEQLTVNSNQ
jgi:hypothetical protein